MQKKALSKAALLAQEIDKIFMKHGSKVIKGQKTGNFITKLNTKKSKIYNKK